MSERCAQVLVFVTSAAVLVLEILAGRRLAPYVRVSRKRVRIPEDPDPSGCQLSA